MIIYFMETIFIWYILIFVMPSGQKAYLLFSTFLFVLWIIPVSNPKMKLTPLLQRFHSVIRVGLTLLFALMCIKGYPNTIAYEITEPYTMGKITAEYLNQNCTDQDVLIFIDNAYEPSVTAYLNRNLRVWDITEACFASFPLWSIERTNNNSLFYYLYYNIIDNNATQGVEGYTGTAMNDFLKQYIDSIFPEGTNIWLVMTLEMAELYDLENSSPYYELRARLNGDCKYSKESFSVYHMVSGL